MPSFATDISFSIPGAGQLYVWNLASPKDGSIVVGGLAVGKESQGSGFLAIIAHDRSRKTIVRTAPFIPRALTVDAKGVIWAIGWDVDETERTYNVLRRFDGSGALLSTSKLQVEVGLGGDASDGSTLRSSGDRVAWLTGASEYIEFSLDGSEMNRFAGPPWTPTTSVMTTMAIDEHNDVLAASMDKGERDHPIWILNRAKRAWDHVEIPGEKLSPDVKLFGFDGDDVVMGATSAERGYLIIRYGLSAGSGSPALP